jgi:hypothetical protein
MLPLGITSYLDGYVKERSVQCSTGQWLVGEADRVHNHVWMLTSGSPGLDI